MSSPLQNVLTEVHHHSWQHDVGHTHREFRRTGRELWLIPFAATPMVKQRCACSPAAGHDALWASVQAAGLATLLELAETEVSDSSSGGRRPGAGEGEEAELASLRAAARRVRRLS
jgi:hypothetical protein